MVTTVVRGPETRAQKRKRVRDAKLGEAIPGLLDDIVITHVLRSEHFDDPADLARLKAVSCAMPRERGTTAWLRLGKKTVSRESTGVLYAQTVHL